MPELETQPHEQEVTGTLIPVSEDDTKEIRFIGGSRMLSGVEPGQLFVQGSLDEDGPRYSLWVVKPPREEGGEPVRQYYKLKASDKRGGSLDTIVTGYLEDYGGFSEVTAHLNSFMGERFKALGIASMQEGRARAAYRRDDLKLAA